MRAIEKIFKSVIKMGKRSRLRMTGMTEKKLLKKIERQKFKSELKCFICGEKNSEKMKIHKHHITYSKSENRTVYLCAFHHFCVGNGAKAFIECWKKFKTEKYAINKKGRRQTKGQWEFMFGKHYGVSIEEVISIRESWSSILQREPKPKKSLGKKAQPLNKTKTE